MVSSIHTPLAKVIHVIKPKVKSLEMHTGAPKIGKGVKH